MSASEDAPPPEAAKEAPPAWENPLEKIEQLLTCSICLDRFKQPKLLPCQHTFCLACLSSYADSAHRRLKCPECRAEHPLDAYEGVAAYPTNLTLVGFLDIHLQATDASAAEFKTYIEQYNLERCKICEEKAQLKICAHCDRKACDECRSTHVEMLKRDLARLLNQVKRLSNRLREASSGLDKILTSLLLNGDNTKSEMRDYFQRYREELRQREAHFLGEADAFIEAECRVVSTLRDSLIVEASNVDEACTWTNSVLAGKRIATDIELNRMKNLFVDGVNYLRNFQPDSDDLFGKKLRFSPGDDASKLPSAISNFGELMVCLPQCGNRYLPLEAHYLPKPLRLPLESDVGRVEDSTHVRSPFAYGSKSATDDRYLRRLQLEEEAWERLRVSSGGSENHSRCASPLVNARPLIGGTSLNDLPITSTPLQLESVTSGQEDALLIDTAAATSTPKISKSTSKDSMKNVTSSMSAGPLAASVSTAKPKSSSAATKPPPTVASSSKTLQKQNSRDKLKLQKPSDSKQNSQPEQATSASSSNTSTTINNVKPVSSTPLPQAQHSLQHTTAVSKNGLAEELARKSNEQSSNNSHKRLCSAQVETMPSRRIINATILPSRLTDAQSRPENKRQKNDSENNNISRSDAPETRLLASKIKPPLPRQRSSQEDRLLNEKVAHIRKNHERIDERIDRIRQSHAQWVLKPQHDGEETATERPTRSRSGSIVSIKENNIAIVKPTPLLRAKHNAKSRILYRSSSSRPLHRECFVGGASRLQLGEPNSETAASLPTGNTTACAAEELRVIPIIHYPLNSCGDWPHNDASGRRFSQSNPSLNNSIETVAATTAAATTGAAITPSPRVLQLLARREIAAAASANANSVEKATEDDDADSHRLRWHCDVKKLSSRGSQRRRSSTTPDRFGSDLLSEALVDYTNKKLPTVVIGKRGDEPGCMNWPRGITSLPGGEFAVCDSANHRIQIFDANGRHLTSFGDYGTGAGQLDGCAGVAYHRYRKQLVVTDRYNHRVQLFDLDGQFVRQFGSRGTSPGQFNNPWGVAVDEIGLIYVADKDNHRVQVFDRTGRFIHMFGRLGDKIGQFNHPLFIAIQPQIQEIFVTDSANNRVSVHAHDGTPLRIVGAEGFYAGELKLPRGIAVDAQGYVIVADSGNNRVQIFAPNGGTVAVFGAWGCAPGKFKGVEAVALSTNSRRIVCADRENHRVQIF